MANLRPYQIDAINSIYAAWDSCNSVLLQMATGLGKTTVFSSIVKDFAKNHPNKRILILVHRIELLEQVESRLRNFGILATAISTTHDFNINQKVVIATIQSLIKRLDEVKNFSLIVVDEAHHSTSSSYLRVFEHYASDTLKILGVTATPQRLDGQGFDGIYDVLIPTGQIRDYIPEYLCDVTQRASSHPDFKTIKIDPITKDYESAIARMIMSDLKVMADLVKSFKEYCLDKRTLIFAVNTEHSLDIVHRLQNEGIRIQHIDYRTPKDKRKQIVTNFRDGKLNALSSVEIFTEGFDCPEVDVVIMARPTKSLVLYLQQAGRCLRPKSDGRKGLILDHAKLWIEHGLIKSNRFWSLSGTKEEPNTEEFKKSLLKLIKSRKIKLPKEIEELVMEEFQLAESQRLPNSTVEKVLIDKDWWEKLPPKLQEILINSCQIDKKKNEDITEEDLLKIWNLEFIDLSNVKISPTLYPLQRLRKIRKAECCMMDYHTLKSFSNWHKLEYLDLSFSSITKLTPLKELESLKYLNISNTQIESLNPILEHRGLKELHLSNSKISNVGLIERLPYIERLSLNGLKMDTSSFLRNLRKLNYLNISHTNLSDLKYLNGKENFHTLIAHDCNNLDFSTLDMEKLKALDCSYSSFNNLKHLTQNSRNVNLEWLNISGCRISDLFELRYFDKLKLLILNDIDIDDDLINDILMMNNYLIIHKDGEQLSFIENYR